MRGTSNELRAKYPKGSRVRASDEFVSRYNHQTRGRGAYGGRAAEIRGTVVGYSTTSDACLRVNIDGQVGVSTWNVAFWNPEG